MPLTSLLCFSDANTEVRLSQNQSKTARPHKVVRISCKLSGIALDNVIVHWYEQKEGEPLKRILYSSTKNFIQDNFNPRLESETSNGIFYLIINNVIESDEAIYYCACWDLTMSQSQKELVGKPALFVTLPHRLFNALTLRCKVCCKGKRP